MFFHVENTIIWIQWFPCNCRLQRSWNLIPVVWNRVDYIVPYARPWLFWSTLSLKVNPHVRVQVDNDMFDFLVLKKTNDNSEKKADLSRDSFEMFYTCTSKINVPNTRKVVILYYLSAEVGWCLHFCLLIKRKISLLINSLSVSVT